VQNALYDEVVSNGWYERRPDATRSRFTQLALAALIVAVIITVILAAFTTFGLVGLALEEISEVLPYAIVLGGTERWLDALVAADSDTEPDPEDLPWYSGPQNWHLRDLPDSMKNFVTTVSGSLFSR
jgi:hypothetical protein